MSNNETEAEKIEKLSAKSAKFDFKTRFNDLQRHIYWIVIILGTAFPALLGVSAIIFTLNLNQDKGLLYGAIKAMVRTVFDASAIYQLTY
jgi:hypothetical protein